MTQREIDKLKLLDALNSNIFEDEVKKYSCARCADRKCECVGGTAKEGYKTIIFKNDTIWVHTCFEKRK